MIKGCPILPGAVYIWIARSVEVRSENTVTDNSSPHLSVWQIIVSDRVDQIRSRKRPVKINGLHCLAQKVAFLLAVQDNYASISRVSRRLRIFFVLRRSPTFVSLDLSLAINFSIFSTTTELSSDCSLFSYQQLLCHSRQCRFVPAYSDVSLSLRTRRRRLPWWSTWLGMAVPSSWPLCSGPNSPSSC